MSDLDQKTGMFFLAMADCVFSYFMMLSDRSAGGFSVSSVSQGAPPGTSLAHAQPYMPHISFSRQ